MHMWWIEPRVPSTYFGSHICQLCWSHTSARLLYSITAVGNLVIHRTDISNAFGEVPTPRQGFYIRPDNPFHEWWTKHLSNPPISDCMVILVQRAMQGHPEAPRLWKKHIHKILRDLGLTPTIHEPCMYSGMSDNERVLFMRQVDNFSRAPVRLAPVKLFSTNWTIAFLSPSNSKDWYEFTMV